MERASRKVQKPKSRKVIVNRPFNATGTQRRKGEQKLSQEEYEFAVRHDCLENGV